MIWVFTGVGAVLVVVVAWVTVARATAPLDGTLAPTVFEMDHAVDWIAPRLPSEVSATLSYTDVERVLAWLLDYFGEAGMASEFGEEIAGSVDSEHATVARLDDAVDYAVAQGLAEGDRLDSVHVVVVAERFVEYLASTGAIGDVAGS